MHLMTAPPRRRQRGITLIESLIAIVVAALGILGIVGVQMRTLTDTQTSVRRAQAVRLIEDLGERLRVAPNALADINAYPSGFANMPTVTSCASNCTPAQLAAYNLSNWKNAVATTLPRGQANIFFAPGEGTGAQPNRRQLGVMISWRENERDTSATTALEQKKFKDNIDATKVSTGFGATLTDGANAANACPAGRTCHLQYLPVAARCAPYLADATAQFFCPGT